MGDPSSPDIGCLMSYNCVDCECVIRAGWAFGVNTAGGVAQKCLLHTLGHAPIYKRAFVVCLIVGSLLIGLNQGDVLLAGRWNTPLFWKIPLTYVVPFIVTIVGGLLNSRH